MESEFLSVARYGNKIEFRDYFGAGSVCYGNPFAAVLVIFYRPYEYFVADDFIAVFRSYDRRRLVVILHGYDVNVFPFPYLSAACRIISHDSALRIAGIVFVKGGFDFFEVVGIVENVTQSEFLSG